MLTSLLILLLIAFGLCVLFADSHLLGVPVSVYNEALSRIDQWEELDRVQEIYVDSITISDLKDKAESLLKDQGVLKVRNKLLHLSFFRELLGCYFCLGFWCGMLSHALLIGVSHLGVFSYSFSTGTSYLSWPVGLFFSGLVAAPGCFLINLVASKLEDCA